MTETVAQVKLATMAAMQEEHNLQVHPEWRSQNYPFYRAAWVECAEMLDHFGWKWWKKQQPDLDQVKLELVDIWHFGLSELMTRADAAIDPRVADVLGASVADSTSDGEAFRLAIEALGQDSIATQSFSVTHFRAAMETLPMSYDELFELYVGKNMLNRFRQAHGYKTGEYRKTWAGREDNDHLIELIAALNCAPEAVPAALYTALEQRYAETAS